MSVTRPTSGRFVGYDLVTTDLEGATKFYGDLFGWTFEPAAAGAVRIFADKVGIGAISVVPDGGALSPQWLGAVNVADLEAALSVVDNEGGVVITPAAEVPGHGKFAVVSDPQGAILQLVSFASTEPESDKLEVGHFCWNELVTKDAARAGQFYSALLGWTVVEKDMGPAGIYHLCLRGDKQEAGIWPVPAEAVRPVAWLTHVHVQDVEKSTAQVEELGGFILREIHSIPGIGRFSMVVDPHGARFALFTPESA